jgi:prohibitin 1
MNNFSTNFLSKKLILGITASVVAITLLTGTIGLNSPTEVSVVSTFGKTVARNDGGFYFKTPLFSRETKYSTALQSIECITGEGRDNCKSLDASTKDLQQVKVSVQVGYTLNPDKVNDFYRLVQDQRFFNDVIFPQIISEGVKTATSKYTSEELVTKRAELKIDSEKEISTRLEKYSLILRDVNIANIGFSDAYAKAIENKNIVEQETKKAILEKQKAQAEAEIKLTQAEVDAKTKQIIAGAEAKSNETISKSITQELLQKQAIEKWNGVLPQVQGAGTNTIIDLGKKQ